MTNDPAMWSVSAMFAACPACKTVFPVSSAQLRAAGGRVRCGNCEKVFVATDALFDNSSEAFTFAEQQLNDVSREIDDLVGRALDGVPASREPVDTAPEETGQAVSSQQVSDAADLVDLAINTVTPVFPADVDIYAAPVAAEFVSSAPVDEPVAKQASSAALLFESGLADASTSWGTIAAALFLTALLLGQYVWSERYRLSGNASFRPYLDAACATLGCDLPLRLESAKLEVLGREIRNHPHVDDALLVSATFTNAADFVQGYPIFEVAFSNVSGTPVAVRRFLPDEYLNDVDASKGMAPGQQTRLMLEIVDPGDGAVSFQFDFH